ncbi:MAG: DUF4230 domain-containing protein [Synergistaceae bacterium]|nr:DUF4230 domain-containing protein [Synergistaceae bacterium]MBQ6664981.1 DUF4230 domain-containing protein [Synergistaceae bacterium]MBR0248863.1 DUF4230 domain-containing protein [Synergistaceae bacterium]
MFTLILILVIAALSAVIYFLVTRKPATTVRVDLIAKAIESCCEMTTLKVHFETVADSSKENDSVMFIPLPGTWRRLLVIFEGTLSCGFDMKCVRAEVMEPQKRVAVILPHAKILRVEPHMEDGKVNVYDSSSGWFTKDPSPTELKELLSAALKAIRVKAAEEWDVISQAEDNAAVFFRDFLGSLGYEVSVAFTDDESRLSIPSGAKTERMKGGGVVIFRAA